MQSRTWNSSAQLYDVIAADYDESFTKPGHRRAYDMLAGAYIDALLPAAPARIVDAGCGTGRWAARWLARGHQVTGIEQSAAMIEILRRQVAGAAFTLIEASMEQAEIAADSADLVVAMGSVQYTCDPATTIRRFAAWAKPGGAVCVYVDSRLGLVLDLLRAGDTEEALLRAESGQGRFRHQGESADLHLYDRQSLRRDLEAAGLVDVDCRGLVITAAALGRAACAEAMEQDSERFLALERRLSGIPALADAGLHLIASGRRPA